MKKIIFILFLLFFPLGVGAQTCPFGLENDPAPGSCGRFIDENDNALCDLSEVPLDTIEAYSNSQVEVEPEPEYISGEELKKYTISEIAEMYEVDNSMYAQKISEYLGFNIKIQDSLQRLHDEYNLCSGVAGAIALDLKNQTREKIDYIPASSKAVETKTGKNLYNVIPVILVLIILYLFTYILVKENKISLLTHRRLWNVLLLISFLISGILGLLLVIRINDGWSLVLPFNMLYWHVEAGIVMAVITIFHISWHWRYYTCIFKSKNKCKTNDEQ